MTISTLATCVQEGLPITVIVANNQGLGMVREIGNRADEGVLLSNLG